MRETEAYNLILYTGKQPDYNQVVPVQIYPTDRNTGHIALYTESGDLVGEAYECSCGNPQYLCVKANVRCTETGKVVQACPRRFVMEKAH